MSDIRKATPADLYDIHTMVQGLSAFHGDTAKVSADQLHDIFFGPAPKGTAFIAMKGDVAVGYAGVTSMTVLHTADIRLDIQHLFVHEGHRGIGIGTALILAAQAHATSVGAVRLTIGTDASNATAIATYRALAFLSEITDTGPRFAIDLTT